MPSFDSLTDRSTSLLILNKPLWALILLGGLAIALLVYARAPAPEWPQPDSARAVRIDTVTEVVEPERLRLAGLLRASEQAELAFLHAGQLSERRVKRGQSVLAGDSLALLYNPALSPGLAAAEARLAETNTQLAQAERDLSRTLDLHRRSLVPTEEKERAESRRDALRQAADQAEAQRREASELLDVAHLRAPFAGTVTEVHIEAGEFVAAGQTVLVLVGADGLEVEIDLGAERAARLNPSQPAQVIGPGLQGAVHARVIEIGQARAGRPARVRLALDEPPLHWQPGLGVQVEIAFDQAPALGVPLAAIIDPGSGRPRLFRVEQDRAILVPLVLGSMRGGLLLVDGPLAAGDSIIVAGHGQLLDGETVRVLR
ncbi:MAG: efflux RND transporter periplasmic adaptor subunit [Wenzhouxiangellaceae bacterium]|nr:MAG: efflux RND transporter periplasmic adaptor subunit [Wenzhouxiangellaceae bacterium]